MEKKEPDSRADKQSFSATARFSAMAFQMIVIIGLAALGGIKLDKIIPWKFPVFTLVFTLLGVFIALYYFIHEASRLQGRKKEKNKF